MIPICRHIKTDGARCKAIALRDRPYCYYHDRLHGVLTRRSSTPKNSFMLHPLEDRDSVFLALSDVICGLAARHIDPDNATRLIHGLQVAGKYAPESSSSVAKDAIQSLDFTYSGDELAPKLSYCTPDDDCGFCPNHDDCGSEQAQAWRAAHAGDDEEDDSEEDGNDDEDEGDDEEDDDNGEQQGDEESDDPSDDEEENEVEGNGEAADAADANAA